MKCPFCGGQTELTTLPFEAFGVTIPNAKLNICSECGDYTVHAKELKRWRKISNTKIRGRINMSEIEITTKIELDELARLLATEVNLLTDNKVIQEMLETMTQTLNPSILCSVLKHWLYMIARVIEDNGELFQQEQASAVIDAIKES